MKVAAVVNVHNEGMVEIAKSLARHPAKNVTPILGDIRAFLYGRRFFDENIARACNKPYPTHCGITKMTYGRQRAAALITRLHQGEYDVILDIHGTAYKGNDAAYVHFDSPTGMYTSGNAIAVAGCLGFTKMIGIKSPGLPSYFKRAITIDVSPDSCFRKSWRKDLEWLGESDIRDFGIPAETQIYRHLGTITEEVRDRTGLERVYDGFALIPEHLAAQALGHVANGAQAVTWGDKVTGFAGELVSLERPTRFCDMG